MVEIARLPGVYFQSEIAATRQTLPRMDIAAFAGLAASGPIDTPVPAEDVGRFHELFGAEASLGGDLRAQLAPAVRAFFRNGGRRGWIVRVAGAKATSNTFALPGLRHVSGNPALATARSEGSWSDTLAVNTTLTRIPITLAITKVGNRTRLDPQLGAGLRLQPGDLLELSFPAQARTAYIVAGPHRNLYDDQAHWYDSPLPLPDWTTKTWQAALLTFELWVRAADRTTWRLSGLGFSPDHPRYWGWLPTDTDLFPRLESPIRTPPAPALRLDAFHPRFPLAGPGDAGLYLPRGMSGLLREEEYTGPTSQSSPPLERDGLDTYDSSIFLDTVLQDTSVSTLLDRAFQTQYQDRNPRPLRGLHALLRIEEPSILSVPDAVQPNWLVEPPLRPERLEAPHLHPITGPRACWTAVPNADTYELEDIYTGPLTCAGLPKSPSGCPQLKYYRVRARRGGLASPWSNTEVAVLPRQSFTACDARLLTAPVLDPVAPAPHARLRLTWTAAAGSPDSYQVESAADPEFRSAKVLQQKNTQSFEFLAPQLLTYFRVRPLRGSSPGPASNTVLYDPPQPPPPPVPANTESPSTRALRLHTAMLRMCAARGDMFAVLSLPQDFQEPQTLQHRAALLQALADDDPDRTLSFGAIYHPWTTIRETQGPADARLRTVSPDGAICGHYAARTLASGAWYAPANMLLRGVISLDPRLDDAALTFYTSQINQVRQFPRGFAVHASETLSPSRDLRSVNVRRLLILLRRLALREGMLHVFESNTPSFRRLVQRQWELVLGDLFVRGAFAGATRDESFRVLTDDTINTRQSLELGRFIVELRVAPSEPLHFLTVRLIQTGNEILLAEELQSA